MAASTGGARPVTDPGLVGRSLAESIVIRCYPAWRHDRADLGDVTSRIRTSLPLDPSVAGEPGS
jgi:hypothetical protein